MSKYVEREVVEYVLPLEKHVTILHPENVVLRFGKNGISNDVGARCYLERLIDGRPRRRKGLMVDSKSFDKARTKKIRQLILHLSQEVELSGKGQDSVRVISSDFLRFLDWCDAVGHQVVLGNKRHARSAYQDYIEHLRDRVQKDDLNLNTAVNYQNHVAALLGSLQDLDDLNCGIRILRKSLRESQPTNPPDEDAQGKTLALCEMLFEGISSFVINQRSYPFRLAMPGYLGWKNNYLWLLPAERWFIAPHELRVSHEMKIPNWAMDSANGRLATHEDIVRHYSEMSEAKRRFRITTESIVAANNDSQLYRRRRLAMVAHKAFVLMFVANTGMNWAEVRKLPWGADYEVGLENQGFREIKLRAGGKRVSFRIETSFLSKFKRYLDLRGYLLNGQVL